MANNNKETDYVMHTLTGGEDTGCPQRRSSKVLFNVRIEIIEKFRSTVGQPHGHSNGVPGEMK